MIKLNDLGMLHEPLMADLNEAFLDCLATSNFVGGQSIATFESNFAAICGSNYCVSVANGTDAIEIGLTALGVGPGDEVIVPSLTWISTAEAVSNLGAVPIFADCTLESACMSWSRVEDHITDRTVGVITVHLHGAEANTAELASLCDKYNLWLVEDSAQSHLLNKYSHDVGRHSIFSTYSFFPGKNLGALGDAGALLTNDEEFSKRCRLIANHGTSDKINHHFPGRNSRMDALQAEILNIKLNYLDIWTTRRREVAQLYRSFLSDIEQVQILLQAGQESVFHQLVILVSYKRDQLRDYLFERGVQTGLHYPTPLPLLDAYKGAPGSFYNAAHLSKNMLSLPCHPHLSNADVRFVASEIKKFFL